MNKRKIHDGIVGVVIIITVALAYFSNMAWLWIPLILGAVLLQSAFTGFCPLYYTLDKLKPGEE